MKNTNPSGLLLLVMIYPAWSAAAEDYLGEYFSSISDNKPQRKTKTSNELMQQVLTRSMNMPTKMVTVQRQTLNMVMRQRVRWWCCFHVQKKPQSDPLLQSQWIFIILLPLKSKNQMIFLVKNLLWQFIWLLNGFEPNCEAHTTAFIF